MTPTPAPRRWLGSPVLVAGALVLATGLLEIASASGLNVVSTALTPYRTCTITGSPAASTAVADSSVRQGSPGSNFGTQGTNNVASASGANRRLYVRFDLTACNPAIPSTATIRLATMRIYATILPTSCRTIDVFRVLATWAESTITWTNQPFGATVNNPAAGTASDTFAIGTPVGCQNLAAGYVVGLAVTADVAAFVAGTATNFGWMLRDNVEGNATAPTSTLSAKDLGNVGQAPQLVVTYVVTP